MTALSQSKARRTERINRYEFTLTSGQTAYKNGIAALVLATGKVIVGASTPGTIFLGTFTRDVDASAADTTCTVHFDRELVCERFANGAGGDALASTDVGRLCYVVDDQTVGKLSTGGRPVAGRVINVSSTLGVLVEKLPCIPLDSAVGAVAASIAFVANDSIVTPALLDSAKVITIPATGAASTVTLPAGARAGQSVTFVADGTNNGHTVQYRDATGPTNLTTALTASKRHLVKCVFDGTNWYANAYVSP
jgi:hypothetical protein